MAETTYTLADLEAARAECARLDDADANDTSNNPDKFQSRIKAARRRFREIQDALKSAGVIPLTEKEQLERELDKAFPNARSKEVVEHNGKRYRRWFYPAEKSNSGKTVKEWDSGWEEAQ